MEKLTQCFGDLVRAGLCYGIYPKHGNGYCFTALFALRSDVVDYLVKHDEHGVMYKVVNLMTAEVVVL